MAQREKNMVCQICGKTNPDIHQDFCRDLECSGRLILPIGLPKCTCAADGGAPHEGWCPAALKIGERVKEPLQNREGLKYIDTVPEGDHCVAMLMFKDTMYVATGKGVYKMVDDKLEAVQFAVKDGENCCEHGKTATEYCEPCGRVNGGG